jgi:protein-tyrosine phosphatase
MSGSEERVIELDGGLNVRDLGGYETRDGRRVKQRMIFRSGSVAWLTKAGRTNLTALGIRALCDLRTTGERAFAPFDWTKADGYSYWSRDCASNFGELRALMATDLPTADAARDAMLKGYRRLPIEQAPAYQEIFRRLRANDLPLMFNCSAGKDRAGMASALILTTLSVRPELVLEDYLLSNALVDLSRLASNRPDGKSSLAKQPPEVTGVILGCDRSYLDAAFAAIEETCGSFATYLSDVLHIEASDVDAIRNSLLE